jgi:uncharacterized oligopeptide transporter (OPT) family protein
MSASPYNFWKMPGQCGSCQKAAAENYKHMNYSGTAKEMYSGMKNNRMVVFGSGLVIGAVLMHLLMHRK